MVVGNGGMNTQGCTEMDTGPNVKWGRDRERAGRRKGRERGGGKKLRGTGEDEPPRYKECAAFKKGREKGRKGQPKKRTGKPIHAHNFLFFILLFIYFSLSVILLLNPADSRRNPSPRPASPFSVYRCLFSRAPTALGDTGEV